jgi:hypothetical protein
MKRPTAARSSGSGKRRREADRRRCGLGAASRSAEIGIHNRGIGHQALRGTLTRNPADFDEVAAIGNLQALPRVLLDKQDADAGLGDLRQ